MPDSSPDLGFSARLLLLVSCRMWTAIRAVQPRLWGNSDTNKNCSPPLLYAWALHVGGMAGCESFRQQNLCEVNVTYAERPSKPMAGEVGAEILSLFSQPWNGTIPSLLSLKLLCPSCLCFAEWKSIWEVYSNVHTQPAGLHWNLMYCTDRLTFPSAAHSLPFRSLGPSYLTRTGGTPLPQNPHQKALAQR